MTGCSVNNEFESIWKEMVTVEFEVLNWYLDGLRKTMIDSHQEPVFISGIKSTMSQV